MLGLKRGTVALAAHEKEWELETQKTIAELRSILGDIAVDIQHVGSTSVASIAAKPIIDIAVAVDDFGQVTAKAPQLEKAGYYLRETDLSSQLLFACGSYYDGSGDLQTRFIHVVKRGSEEWRNYINFRDYLRANEAAAKQYEALKMRLAAECPVDAGRERYLAGKHGFIVHTLRKATVWSFLGKRVTVTVDRPVGYVHKKEKYTLVYPINYGYIDGVLGGDGEELDVYYLGLTEPAKELSGRVIAIIHRENDVEDKLVAAPDGVDFSESEIADAVRFQEQYYETRIELYEKY